MTPRRTLSRARSGFTMLELVISVALAAFVTMALYQLFSIQSRQMAFLDLQAEMHQNLRFATDILTRSIRVAGLGTSGSVTGVFGWGGDDNESLPAVISYDAGGSSGTDAITVVYQEPSLIMSTDIDQVPSSATTTLYMDMRDRRSYFDPASQIQNYQAGELILCLDYASQGGMEAYLWTISGVTPASGLIQVEPNTVYTDYVAAVPLTENLTSVMTCSKGQVVTFYIDNVADTVGPGSEEHPVLMMDMDLDWPEADDVPLVDDIEDLQFAYCLADTNCIEGGWTWGLSRTDIPWMVRVSLIARSARTAMNRQAGSRRPLLENHSGTTGEDGYYRQVLSTEVTLRNLRNYSNLSVGTHSETPAGVL